MNNLIRDFFWDNFISRYFLIGKRRILLIPILAIPAVFWFVQQFFNLPDFRTTLTHRYFYIPSIIIAYFIFGAYFFITNRLPPRDRFLIAVAKFYPVSDGARDAAANTRHLIIRAIGKRMEEYKIKDSIIELQETVNPETKDGNKLANLLLRHNRAHVIICGVVMHDPDQEYYFTPLIFQQFTPPYRFSPRGDTAASTQVSVPAASMFIFAKQKAAEVTDLASFMCAIARVNELRYAEAEEILSKIEKPSAEVLFFRGFALLQLGRLEQSLSFFQSACSERPSFSFAWMYAGVVEYELHRDEEAKRSFEEASRVNKEAAENGIIEDAEIFNTAFRHLGVTSMDRFLDLMDRFVNIMTEEEKKRQKRLDQYKLENEARKHFYTGLDQFFKEEYDQAIKSFEESIKINPDYGDAWAYEGLVFAVLEQRNRAEQSLRKGSELDGDRFSLAKGYAILHDKENMLAQLTEAIKKDRTWKIIAHGDEAFEPFQNDDAFKELTKNWDLES